MHITHIRSNTRIYTYIQAYPYIPDPHMHPYTYIRQIPITHHPQHLTENKYLPNTWKTYTQKFLSTTQFLWECHNAPRWKKMVKT